MMLEHIPHLASKKVILASASPRRLQLLQMIGLVPRVVTSTFAEDLSKSDFRGAADYAVATSQHKALEVAERLQTSNEVFDLIIGADTVRSMFGVYMIYMDDFVATLLCRQVVDQGGNVMEKPDDAQHAIQMLQKYVFTANPPA